MEIKGIDVSSYQGKPDWAKVAKSGIKFAILRVHQRTGIDSSFEYNYKGCKGNGILIGGYKYSYALTPAQAINEAEDVIAALNGRGLDFPVFYDLEWTNQRKLGSQAIENIAVSFLNRIKKAGYEVGIYCNLDWYNNVLSDTLKQYDCWIARYPASNNGTLHERLRPDFGVGWQYSSKATIPGISGTVDRNVFYKDYAESKKQEGGTDVDKAIEKVILIAKNEEGYLEKKSNSQLDSKTANAGSANFTKYWRDVLPEWNGSYWCAVFIAWCFMKAFGLETAKKLLKHWPYVYCPDMQRYFKLNANPKVGDIVIFWNSKKKEFVHTGLVTAVIGDRFYTIEGNTSGASDVISNGGGVCAKSYLNSQLPGTKFCTPDYSIVNGETNNTKENSNTATGGKYMFKPETVQLGSTGTSVLLLQEILVARGFKGKNGKVLDLDREAGDNTIYALKQYQKSRGLEVDGVCGSATWKDLIAI